MPDSFRINEPALRALLQGPNGLVWRDIQTRSNRVQNAAKRLCPWDEGRLRASIDVEMRVSRLGPIGRIGTNVEYAIYVHEGTGIYAGRGLIRPKKAGGVLAWPAKNNSGKGRRRYKGGKTAGFAFAKYTKGMRGRPFLRNALPAAK